MNVMGGGNEKIYLQPGELVMSKKPAEISTVLGSCVSVVFYLPRLQMGGMCHAVLPRDDNRDNGVMGKYVDQSIRYMYEYISALQVKRSDIVVKLFGGASMFGHEDENRRDLAVGAQNVREALDSLRNVGLVPNVSDIGGERGRKLIFYAHTGEVLLKRVGTTSAIATKLAI